MAEKVSTEAALARLANQFVNRKKMSRNDIPTHS